MVSVIGRDQTIIGPRFVASRISNKKKHFMSPLPEILSMTVEVESDAYTFSSNCLVRASTFIIMLYCSGSGVNCREMLEEKLTE